MVAEKRYALLIDGDNISHKYIDLILRELRSFGSVTIRRVYGDWTANSKKGWRDKLLENSLTPVQQYNYTIGKNSSDFALVIDAMDILYSNNVDGYVLVSSDSDFTKLAMRLREAGKHVIGMGESKTPSPFVKACENFLTLDMLYKLSSDSDKKKSSRQNRKNAVDKNQAKKRSGKKHQEFDEEIVAEEGIDEVDVSLEEVLPITDIEDIKEAILSIVENDSDEDGWTFLADLPRKIQKIYPDFDHRNYGYRKFAKMIEDINGLKIRREDSSNGVTKLLYVHLE